MFFRLFLLFTLVPLVELYLLIKMGGWIGAWPTVGLIFATGAIGGLLARWSGLSVWRRLQQRLRSGGLPGRELTDGAIVLMSGALLVTPGVLTDVAGFLGLIPFTRAWIRKGLLRWAKKNLVDGNMAVYMRSAPPRPSAEPKPPPPSKPGEIYGEWQSEHQQVTPDDLPEPTDPS